MNTKDQYTLIEQSPYLMFYFLKVEVYKINIKPIYSNRTVTIFKFLVYSYSLMQQSNFIA